MDAEQGSDSEEYEKMSLEDDYDVRTFYTGSILSVHHITSVLSETTSLYQVIDDTYEYPEVPPFEDYPVQPPPQPDEACI